MLGDRLSSLTAQVARFTDAVGAGGGDLLPLVKALREREDERARVEAELAALIGSADIASFDAGRLRRTLVATLDDWRGLLARQTTQAREALQTLLDGRTSSRRRRTRRRRATCSMAASW